MIKVSVELISAVATSRNKLLGVMYIANDGTGDQEIGSYTRRCTPNTRRQMGGIAELLDSTVGDSQCGH